MKVVLLKMQVNLLPGLKEEIFTFNITNFWRITKAHLNELDITTIYLQQNLVRDKYKYIDKYIKNRVLKGIILLIKNAIFRFYRAGCDGVIRRK